MWLIKKTSFGPWRVAGVAVLAAAGLAACGSATKAPMDLRTPTENYGLKVEETPDRIALAPRADGLSPGQRGALAALAQRWRESGGGEVVVQSPNAGGETAARTASAAVAELQSLGVDWVRIEGYPGDGPSAPVVAGFQRLAMVIPDCNYGWDNLGATGDNTPHGHFGCAVAANMAAMIADPRHVANPAGMTPADATRRQNVLTRYRTGEPTATRREEQASGTISTAVSP